MENNLSEYIKVYDNSLKKNVCEKIITFFDTNEKFHNIIQNNGTPNFTQLNFTEIHTKDMKYIHDILIDVVFKYRNLYYQEIGLNPICFPKDHDFEQFRIKKYNLNSIDRFDLHVDVGNHQTAKRFLSFFWYLNDVYLGGETEFNQVSIIPKTGRLVIFPPFWLFPHKGNPPISNSKYLLSTYLHYR